MTPWCTNYWLRVSKTANRAMHFTQANTTGSGAGLEPGPVSLYLTTGCAFSLTARIRL